MRDLPVYILLVGVVLLAANAIVQRQAEYRQEVVQSRTLVHLQRLIDGLCEQVDQQAEQIETLETALAAK